MTPVPEMTVALQQLFQEGLPRSNPPLAKTSPKQDKPRADSRCGSLDIVHHSPAAKSKSKKMRLSSLPTIAEGSCEDFDEAAQPIVHDSVVSNRGHMIISLPSGSHLAFTSPLNLAHDSRIAGAVAEQLRGASDGGRTDLLAWLCPELVSLSCSQFGSCVAQCAFEAAKGKERAMLLFHIQGRVVDLCFSSHGYQVLTTVVETMPVSALHSIAQEMAGKAAQIARDSFGYRVLEAMAMHCPKESLCELASELALEATELSKHIYGSCVLRHILEYGDEACQFCIVQSLLDSLRPLAVDPIAFEVVESALNFCRYQDRSLVVKTFLEATGSTSLADAACSRGGSSILVQIASMNVYNVQLCIQLANAMPRLTQTQFGMRVAHQLGMI